MAKDTGVSQRTIDAVGSALKLTPAELRHLHGLATGTLPAISSNQAVDPTLRDVLDGYHTGPAMLLNVRMDVVAANPLAAAIFGDLAGAPEYENNWLWYLYENHHMIGEWESQARELTATFRGSLCDCLVLRSVDRPASMRIDAIEEANSLHNAQNSAHLVVDYTQGNLTRDHIVEERFAEGLCVPIAPWHAHVQACKCSLFCSSGAVVVGQHKSVETPLFFQSGSKQPTILTGEFPVDTVSCGHHSPCTALLHRGLEPGQVNFLEGSFVDIGHVPIAIPLTIIGCKMLDARSDAFPLDPADHGSSELAVEVRILS